MNLRTKQLFDLKTELDMRYQALWDSINIAPDENDGIYLSDAEFCLIEFYGKLFELEDLLS